MKGIPSRRVLAVRRWFKPVFDRVVGWLAVGILKLLRLPKRRFMSNLVGRLMRRLGPWIREHKVGRANLAAAFPEKTPQEIDATLAGVWENVGRVAAEFPHLDRMTVLDLERGGPADIVYEKFIYDRFMAVRDAGKPTLIFACHLANWELPALMAAHFKFDASVLYRPPNLDAVNKAIVDMRAGCMGTLVASGPDAPFRLANALERGHHVAILVDQHYEKGPDVMFFGRPCKVNPLIARLARNFDCEIRGVRMVRQGDGNTFWIEFTEALALPRDAKGRIDVQGTMQAITTVIEGWVREHPEQWLWLHRRWR
jgi:Kdo2-lipid IVA lauroyltransferase/acyltransferase